jgi:hypothetical protein
MHDVLSYRPSVTAPEENKAVASKHSAELNNGAHRKMRSCPQASPKPSLQRFKKLLSGYSTAAEGVLSTVGCRSLSIMDALRIQNSEDAQAYSGARGCSSMRAQTHHAQLVAPSLPCKRQLPDLPANFSIHVCHPGYHKVNIEPLSTRVLLEDCLDMRSASACQHHANSSSRIKLNVFPVQVSYRRKHDSLLCRWMSFKIVTVTGIINSCMPCAFGTTRVGFIISM